MLLSRLRAERPVWTHASISANPVVTGIFAAFGSGGARPTGVFEDLLKITNWTYGG